MTELKENFYSIILRMVDHMIDPETYACAQKIFWVKLLLDSEYKSFWKDDQVEFCSPFIMIVLSFEKQILLNVCLTKFQTV